MHTNEAFSQDKQFVRVSMAMSPPFRGRERGREKGEGGGESCEITLCTCVMLRCHTVQLRHACTAAPKYCIT